ncbi:MAG TPA: sensor histidine kinase [Candidatus Binatia bacterium]|nr:sensor histidine kinase [Candidatus Binatia bacterium]
MKKKRDNKVQPQPSEAAAAVQQERRRLLRELHDRVLQPLSSVRLRAELCRRELLGDLQALEKELQTIEKNTDSVIAEIRRLIADNQSEADLLPGTLERRLREEMQIFRSRSGLRLKFQCAIGHHRLPYEIERELYFTLREGVLNAVRHSRASELHLSLSQTGNTCRATLEDNGVGFDPLAADSGSHYGLRGMRERIERIGGNLSFRTAPGKGTQIAITIPLGKEGGPVRAK